MSGFHVRVVFLLLVLSVSGSLAAQVPPFQCFAISPIPPLVRPDGLKEKTADLILNCMGGTATPAGAPVPQVDISVALNTNITSRLLGSGLNEALLLIDEPAYVAQRLCEPAPCSIPGVNPSSMPGSGPGVNYGAAGVPNVFQGSPKPGTSNQVAWASVPIDPPGTASYRAIRITNIYTNAMQSVFYHPFAPGVKMITLVVTMTVNGTPVPVISTAFPGLPDLIVAFTVPGLSLSVSGATPCLNGSRTALLNFSGFLSEKCNCG